jgi:hypothetical protein
VKIVQLVGYAFSALAMLGAISCLAGLISLVLGNSDVAGVIFAIAAPGLFIVWLPAMILAMMSTRDSKIKDFWDDALSNSPRAVRFFIYAAWAHAAFAFVSQAIPGIPSIVHGQRSSHLGLAIILVFFAMAVGMLLSAARRRSSENKGDSLAEG